MYVQSISTIALKMVMVSKLVQRKLTPYRSNIGSRSFRKINKMKYFGDYPRQLFCVQGFNHTLKSSSKPLILLLFCLHRRFIFDNRLTGEAYRSLFDILNSVAMCLVEFI